MHSEPKGQSMWFGPGPQKISAPAVLVKGEPIDTLQQEPSTQSQRLEGQLEGQLVRGQREGQQRHNTRQPGVNKQNPQGTSRCLGLRHKKTAFLTGL